MFVLNLYSTTADRRQLSAPRRCTPPPASRAPAPRSHAARPLPSADDRAPCNLRVFFDRGLPRMFLLFAPEASYRCLSVECMAVRGEGAPATVVPVVPTVDLPVHHHSWQSTFTLLAAAAAHVRTTAPVRILDVGGNEWRGIAMQQGWH